MQFQHKRNLKQVEVKSRGDDRVYKGQNQK